MYVSSKTPKDFRCVRQTCNGNYDMNSYSIETIVELLSEIFEQGKGSGHAIDHFYDAYRQFGL